MKGHTRRSQRSVLRTAGVVAIVVGLTGVMSAFSAGDVRQISATGGGRIAGVVTDRQTRVPLPGMCVNAFGNNSSRSATTTADGTFTIANVPADQYRVQFSDCQPPQSPSHLYAPQLFDNQSSFVTATIINLAPGQTVNGVNASLDKVGQIAGVVRAKDTAAPLPGICVGTSDPLGGNSATTGADGSYSMSASPGNNIVFFADCQNQQFAPQYYLNQGQFQTATPLDVKPGVTSAGIDASLSPAGTVSGTVVRNSVGAPLSSILVNILPVGSDPTLTVGFAGTDAQGHYQASALAPGRYTVRFSDPNGTFAFQYFNRVSQPDAATVVTVVGRQDTSAVNASMIAAGTITGQITDAATGGAPNPNVCVYDRLNDVRTAASAFPNLDGSYRLNALTPGSHKVEFADCSFGTSGYPAQFWNTKPGVDTANPIGIQSGILVGGINAAMGAVTPVLTVSPQVGPPGTVIVVSGTCATRPAGANATLEAILTAANDTTSLAANSAVGSGPVLQTTLTVPTTTPSGPYLVRATCSDYTGSTLTDFDPAPFDVTSPPGPPPLPGTTTTSTTIQPQVTVPTTVHRIPRTRTTIRPPVTTTTTTVRPANTTTTVPAVTTTTTLPAAKSGPGELVVNQHSIEPGSELAIAGAGCDPGAPVSFALGDHPLGSTVADSAGNFTKSGSVGNVNVGRYVLTAKCGPTLVATVDVVLTSKLVQGASMSIIIVLLIVVVVGLFVAGYGNGRRTKLPD